jgi:hypothetical protein
MTQCKLCEDTGWRPAEEATEWLVNALKLLRIGSGEAYDEAVSNFQCLDFCSCEAGERERIHAEEVLRNSHENTTRSTPRRCEHPAH